MKTIVIISPDYLTAVYEESKKYSFLIQGYGSFKQAIDGLLKVNSNELMGVGYLGYSLPLVDSNEKIWKSFYSYVISLMTRSVLCL